MGGAQPLAATMNEGTFLGADVDRARIEKRLETRYFDVLIEDVDEAIDQALEWKRGGVREVDRRRRATPSTCWSA